MGVDVAHGISRRERLFRSHDWDDLEARAGLRPLRIPGSHNQLP